MAGYLGNLTVGDDSDEEDNENPEQEINEGTGEPEKMEVEAPAPIDQETAGDMRAKRLERFRKVPKIERKLERMEVDTNEKPKSKPKPKKTTDPVDIMLMNAFKFSLNPVKTTEFLFLSEVRKEVKPGSPAEAKVYLDETTIETALNFRLFQTSFKPKAGYGVFSYLIQSLERLDTSLRRLEYFKPETVKRMTVAGDAAKALVVSYSHTALTESALFGEAFEKVSLQEFITVLKDPMAPGGSVIHLLLQDLGAEAENQASVADVIAPVLRSLETEMRAALKTALPFQLGPVNALQALLKIPQFARYFASLVRQQELDIGPQGWETPTTSATLGPDEELANLSGMDPEQNNTLLAQNEVVHNMLRLLQRMHRANQNQRQITDGRRIEAESILAAFLSPSAMSSKFSKNVFPEVQRITVKGLDQKFTYVRNLVTGLNVSMHHVFLSLCKANAESRAFVMGWVSRTLQLNESREKMQPDKLSVSGDGLALNLASVMLRLCRPFIEVGKIDSKLGLIDPLFVSTNGGSVSRAFPAEKAILADNVAAGNSAPSINSVTRKEQDFKFVTQCFFYALRAFHLGPMSCMRRIKSLRRRAGYMRRVLPRELISHNAPESEEKKTYEAVLRQLYTVMAATLDNQTLTDALKMYSALAKLVLKLGSTAQDGSPTIPLQQPPQQLITNLPEHFITDCTTLLQTMSQLSQEDLGRLPVQLLAPILHMFVALVSSPGYIKSPHVRAGIAEAIFEVFLPDSAKGEEYQRDDERGSAAEQMMRASVLSESPLAYGNLAPALLLLYGDVEDTGYYESAGHRHHIALILKFIWKNDKHRRAFRQFTKDENASGTSHGQFVRFANGIINQTNDGIAGSLQRLREIKNTQLEMQNINVWSALGEEEKKQKQENLEENERHCESALLLANEVTTMIEYLATDGQFVQAFMNKALISRLAAMLSSVLVNLSGKRGLDFRIDNPEKYNFHPEELLKKIFYILLSFARKGGEPFVKAVAECGFYQYENFRKVSRYFKQKHRVTESESAEFLEYNEKMKAALEEKEKEDLREEEAPEEFLDPLVLEIMEDPVRLKTSGKVVDRQVILQHLLNDKHDPFNRQPLDETMLEELPELKARIEKWKKGGD